MAAGHNVRGALVGRNVLYPGDADPRAIAAAVRGLVHDGWDVDRAVSRGEEVSGLELDKITRWCDEGEAS